MAGKAGVEAPVLSYWCFNAALAMRALAGLGVRSIVLTSGTLAPLNSFAAELGLPFPIMLENPHVVPSNQARPQADISYLAFGLLGMVGLHVNMVACWRRWASSRISWGCPSPSPWSMWCPPARRGPKLS